MRDTLADLTHLLNRLVGEKVTLTLSHDPVLQPIRADKRQLEQVLMNLVVNARDAMPEGGEIRIVTECISLKETAFAWIRCQCRPENMSRSKSSTKGRGSRLTNATRSFNRFSQPNVQGRARVLVCPHGLRHRQAIGRLHLCRFHRRKRHNLRTLLPRFGSARHSTARRRSQIIAPAGPDRDGVILLVEDEAPVRAFASRALRLRGYTVLEADSAEAALKTLEDSTA